MLHQLRSVKNKRSLLIGRHVPLFFSATLLLVGGTLCQRTFTVINLLEKEYRLHYALFTNRLNTNNTSNLGTIFTMQEEHTNNLQPMVCVSVSGCLLVCSTNLLLLLSLFLPAMLLLCLYAI